MSPQDRKIGSVSTLSVVVGEMFKRSRPRMVKDWLSGLLLIVAETTVLQSWLIRIRDVVLTWREVAATDPGLVVAFRLPVVAFLFVRLLPRVGILVVDTDLTMSISCHCYCQWQRHWQCQGGCRP